MNYRKFCQILLCCFVLGILASCENPPIPQAVNTPNPTLTEALDLKEKYLLPNHWDGGLLSEEPCRAPCFAGIIPGKTIETELMDIIENNEHFQGCELTDSPNQGRWVSCNGLIVNIKKTDSTVDGIGFKTSRQFKLEEIMSKYGEPTITWVAPMGIPEAPEVSMIVFWEEEKIRINLEDQEGVVYQLAPSTLVTNIVYYSEAKDSFEMFFQSWRGYGEYKYSR
jgi:hypothetical protein